MYLSRHQFTLCNEISHSLSYWVQNLWLHIVQGIIVWPVSHSLSLRSFLTVKIQFLFKCKKRRTFLWNKWIYINCRIFQEVPIWRHSSCRLFCTAAQGSRSQRTSWSESWCLSQGFLMGRFFCFVFFPARNPWNCRINLMNPLGTHICYNITHYWNIELII